MLVSIPLATEMFSVLHDPASAAKLFEILLRKGGESAKHLVGATDGTNPNPATRRANPVKTEVVIPIPFDPNNPFLIRAE